MARPLLTAGCLCVLAVALRPSEASGQCSVGWPIHKGCFNVSWQGCCTLKETNLGTVTTLQWCENGFLCTAICDPFNYMSAICGWVPIDEIGNGIYDCTDGQYEDPSGAHPYLCDIPCGDVTPEGCCEGQTLLKYCKNGSLNIIDCSRNVDVSFCGWDPVKQVYSCMASPAVGPADHPYTCGEGPQPCEKQCAGKQCGPDGCGGQCGVCPAGKKCDFGQCVADTCTPSCAGKVCGGDGCGGQCGIPCPAGQTCNAAGTGCECMKQCLFKDCGPDGCGGECGTCPPGKECDQNGQCKPVPCTPDCAGRECGSDGCGGACGTCQPPRTCVQAQCVAPGEDPGPMPPDAAGPHSADIEGAPAPCPDGTVRRYGACVPVPPSVIQETPSSGCGAGTGASPAGAFAVVLAAMALARRWRPARVAALLVATVAAGCLSSDRRQVDVGEDSVEPDAMTWEEPGGDPDSGIEFPFAPDPGRPDIHLDHHALLDPGEDAPPGDLTPAELPCAASPFVSFDVSSRWVEAGGEVTFAWTLDGELVGYEVQGEEGIATVLADGADSVSVKVKGDLGPDFATTPITVRVTAVRNGCQEVREATTRVLGSVFSGHEAHGAVEVFRSNGDPIAEIKDHVGTPSCVADLGGGRVAVCNRSAIISPEYDEHPVEVFSTSGAHLFHFDMESDDGAVKFKGFGAYSVLRRDQKVVWVAENFGRILVFEDLGTRFALRDELYLPGGQPARVMVPLPEGKVLVGSGGGGLDILLADGSAAGPLSEPGGITKVLVATRDGGDVVFGGLAANGDGRFARMPAAGGFAQGVDPQLAEGWRPAWAMCPFGEGLLASISDETGNFARVVRVNHDLEVGDEFLPQENGAHRALMVLGGN